MRTCIVTQVKNGFEYIPAFLAHHFNLVDDIFLIDHMSDIDIRSISNANLKVVRINIVDFKKEHYINYVIDKYNIKNQYHFVFIIDIDEFLPFYDAYEFRKFLISHRDNDVISFNWSNGFPKNPGSLNSGSKLYFCKHFTATRKLAYNTLRNRRFLPAEGNHQAKYPLLGLGPIQVRPKIVSTGMALLHIPFTSTNTLKQKFRESDQKYFKKKIEKCAEATGQLLHKIEDDYELNPEKYINFIANYRTANKKDLFAVTLHDFVLCQPFLGQDDAIGEWRNKLENAPIIKDMNRASHGSEALSKLRINSVGYIRRLRASLREDTDGCVTVA